MTHKSKRYFVVTFGCQANKAASERIEGDYQSRGWRSTASWKTADEIVINTCSVRQRAEDRVIGFLNNVKRSRIKCGMTRRPKIILTGCMTHQGKKQLLDMLPLVDEILPISDVGFNLPAVRRDKVHAWIPISEGCNSFCSYCIVPYARGREKSRPEEEILCEIELLVKLGYKEVTLLGQNVNSYGLDEIGIGLRKTEFRNKEFRHPERSARSLDYARDDEFTSPFVQLLQAISKFPKIIKINFMTSNPWDFGDDLIKEIAANKKIDRFIHLPVQSGSNRILKLMSRGYTREDYLLLINKLRKAVPDVTIGTDIIVGFPTETEEDFQQTVDLATKAKWVVAFAAQYSPRPGTAAAKMQDTVSPAIKKKRWEVLDELINKKNLNRRPKID